MGHPSKPRAYSHGVNNAESTVADQQSCGASVTSCRESSEALEIQRLGLIDYRQAWQRQRQRVEARDLGGPDVLFLLEHHSVYTAGKRTEPQDRPSDGTPVIDVDRGGKITWHGPGQLVGYPIIKLSDPIDVVDFVRRLEQGLIAICDEIGVPGTGRVQGRSGVWLPADDTRPERKIAAIGLRVQRGITMHGFEINCQVDPAVWTKIIPCGIADAGVTSLSQELARPVSVAEVLPLAERIIPAAIDGELRVTDRDIARPVPVAAGVTFDLRAR